MNHTVSFELSKRLKEKGFPQTTEFTWIKRKDELFLLHRSNSISLKYLPVEILCSAPLLSEVLEQLPNKILTIKHLMKKGSPERWCFYYDDLLVDEPEPCDAAAKLALQLIDEGIITFKSKGE